MRADKRKIVLVGCGMVGMSYTYSLLSQDVYDELMLIDIDKRRVEREAMDLNHELALSSPNMKIYAGDYSGCRDGDTVVIGTEVAQKPGEAKLDSPKRNVKVFQSIIELITTSGLNGLFLVATNPVGIMTKVTYALSGFNPKRVLGTRTALNTVRPRYLLGEYLTVGPRNIHAYVMGEHGDSESVPQSQAMVSTKPVLELCREMSNKVCQAGLSEIEEEVRGAAYKIIEAKKATYYGIGIAMARTTWAILGDENSVLTVSAMLKGEYGQTDVYAGVPCIISQNGIQKMLPPSLDEEEMKQFAPSCKTLKDSFEQMGGLV